MCLGPGRLLFVGVLLSACASAPSAGMGPGRLPTPGPSATLASPSPSPPAPAAPTVPPPPTPTEMQRLAAATRVLASPNSTVLDTRLVAAYAALRDPRRSAAARSTAARTIQLCTEQLLAMPGWRPAALAAVRTSDRPSLQAILDAGDELTPLGADVSGTPQWRITAPDPAATLIDHYREGERVYGIPWQYLAAINFVETAMGRIHGLSVAGAQGPMQFMPATWADYGHGDVNDPREAVLAAARYLKARGGPGDMDGALYAYNQSHHYVRAIDIFAQQVAGDPDAYTLYYNWDVVVPTSDGPAVIPVGWTSG